jgi:SAM-dependent methyltransferase
MSDDAWNGDEYISRPNVRQAAGINAATIIRAIAAAGDNTPPAEIDLLEVGAGVGVVTPYFKDFKSVYAIEPSPSMASVLATQVDQLPNVKWAIHELTPDSAAQFQSGQPLPSPTAAEPERAQPAPRTHWDVAISTLVVHHVYDFRTFFPGVLDVLQPGGLFVVLEFAPGPDGEDLSAKHHVIEDKDNVPVYNGNDKVISGKEFRATWSRDQLEQLLQRYGFVETGGMEGSTIPAFTKNSCPTQVVWGRKPRA